MYRFLIAIGLVAALCLPFATGAQDPPEERRTSGIESITVTAEKREQDLQDSGLSIQAYTGSELEDMAITSTGDLAALVPGFTFVGASQNPGQLAISGRGLIHADNNPAVAATVGIYIDGVFIQNGNASLLDLLDVKSIQFLKGPQGTLFGRNTLGGAVIIETEKPTPEFGYKAKIRLGENNQRDYFGTLNVPLIGETLLSRISFGRTLQDGFYKNDQPGFRHELNDENDTTFRTALRWIAADDLTVDYTFDWYQMREKPRLNPVNHIHDTAGGVDAFGRLNLAGLIPVPGNGFASVADTLRQFNSGDWRDEDLATFYAGPSNSDQRRNTWNHSFVVDYDLSDSASVKLINGWHRNKLNVFADQDGTPFDIANFGTQLFHRSFNSEIQLVGSAFDGRIDYVLGAMWWEEEYDIENYGGVYADAFLDLSSNTKNLGDSYALGYFSHTTFHITDRLEATIGVRYSTERKQIIRDICAGAFGGVANTIDWSARVTPANCRNGDGFDGNSDGIPEVIFGRKFKERFDAWSPLFRVQYHWTDELMTYVKWSKGFAAGGFGPRSANGSDTANQPYEPEFIFSWEAGVKSRWFDNRLQFNAAGFYNDYDDAQVTTFIPGQGVATQVENAGKARVRGFEFDARAIPLEGLEVTLNHGWTYATFSEFLSGGRNIADDREFAHLPKRKWGGSVRYRFPEIDGIGIVEIFSSFIRESPRGGLSDKTQNAFVTSSTYTLYDARIGLHEAFGIEGLSLAVVGKNVGDRRYVYSQGIDFNPLGFTNFRVSDPRQLFFEISYDRL